MPTNKAPGYAFRGHKYATTKVRHSSDPEAPEDDNCFDTGTSVTLGDRAYIRRVSSKVSNLEVKKLVTPIPVRGLGNQITTTDEYVDLVSYVDSKVDSKPGTAYFTTEVHLVDNLKANILFGNDTIIA